MNQVLKNPIIPGYYPDPSICRVGDDYYLVCSSFEMHPGIPIFHSRNLAHWKQIGNVMTTENGFHTEKNTGIGGVMAPTLRYHDGVFYIINANMADRGNFIVTAKNPAGPWSEPHWLTDVPGIDASLFFDTDGQAYLIGIGDVWDNGTGVKERGFWLAKYDMANFAMASEPVVIFNSALRGAASPEAPHIYHVGEYYYLIFAEGGTEHYHAVMAARSKDLFGFYEGNPANPVMTHRHMGFSAAITNVGHADLVELPDGSWYAVMLASRQIDGHHKNLGRETFICPVVWERGWPLFSPETGKLENTYPAPDCLPVSDVQLQELFCDFNEAALPPEWVFWGSPADDMWRIEDSSLQLRCIRQRPDDDMQLMQLGDVSADRHAAFVGVRLCHLHAEVTTKLHFVPEGNERAGLAVAQAMNHQLHLERVQEGGRRMLRAVLVTSDYEGLPFLPGFSSITHREVLTAVPCEAEEIILQAELNRQDYILRWGTEETAMQELCRVDGRRINPEKVGCMCGTLLGMFATGNGTDSQHFAAFDWFRYREIDK